MNKYHRIAIKNPCRFAFETQRPCLRRIGIDGATIISVNSGHEWLELKLGGPVWHVSVSKFSATDAELLAMALRELDGVGDESLGQWVSRGELALHVRRRLSREEQSLVGDVCDLRHTAEAWSRYNAMAPFMNAAGQRLAMEELASIAT